MTKKQKKEIQKSRTENKNEAALILCNDEHNTFDHVIDSLMIICKHNEIQAVQCTYLAHSKGEAQIENGSVEYMKNLKKELNNMGLTAFVEKI